ncbi:MAG: hypothetical protein MJE63_04880 [Proteobacteria bacterium]|nr:hypothetical protein [Pseudomonadota bacterium]
MNFQTISIDHIDLQDSLFFIENKNLTKVESIEVPELFNPVWLQKKTPNSFRIIDGFLILNVIFKEKKITQVPSRIFEQDADVESLWLFRVKKRISEDNLPPISLLQSLSTLLETVDKNEPSKDIQSLLRNLGFPAKGLDRSRLSLTLNTLIKKCQFCDLPALTYKELYSISRRNHSELNAFSVLLSGCRLKGNKLQSMLQILDELAKGYQLPPQELIKKDAIRQIIEETPTHLKYKTLKTYLSMLRWPVLETTRKQWQQSVKKFTIPQKLDISTDPMFESDCLEFIFKASNITEFREILSVLNSYSSSNDFDRLFDFV